MASSYQDALSKLLTAQTALNTQDISALPGAQAANLEKAKAGLYGEIQALQARWIASRDDNYQVATTAFRDCEAELKDLSKWVIKKRRTDSEIFELLYKGLGIALSLLL
ncbi:MAG: hypothetical protein K9G33_08220 [Sneathiella sp.]|nr:hypothetical protein [Sneathiella sp.]